MKPVLKYRGGKTAEIPILAKYFPQSFDCYIEPFFGGGGVFWHLEPEEAIIADINRRLIDFYQALQSDFWQLKKDVSCLAEQYEQNQAEYIALKKQRGRANTFATKTKNCTNWSEIALTMNHALHITSSSTKPLTPV